MEFYGEMDSKLDDMIEMLRKQMARLASERNSFVDEEVIALSQRLDVFINFSQIEKVKMSYGQKKSRLKRVERKVSSLEAVQVR